MFVILVKLKIGNLQYVSDEGDIQLLKNGLKLHDKNRNIFEVETASITHYTSIEYYNKHA